MSTNSTGVGLHTRFESALKVIKSGLGAEYGMIINGQDHFCEEKFEDSSPIDTNLVLGVFQKGSEEDAQKALTAAREAFPSWSGKPWQEESKLCAELQM